MIQLAGEYWYFDALRWKKQYDLEFIKGAEKDNKFISCLNEIKVWKELYDKESSFWNSNYLWFGVGVITTTAIIFLGGVVK